MNRVMTRVSELPLRQDCISIRERLPEDQDWPQVPKYSGIHSIERAIPNAREPERLYALEYASRHPQWLLSTFGNRKDCPPLGAASANLKFSLASGLGKKSSRRLKSSPPSFRAVEPALCSQSFYKQLLQMYILLRRMPHDRSRLAPVNVP
ncbi:hypothetical protein RhiJN_25296 [Ceratobasidium sp. AG-Ba]|nr:hypothetical protein RhiJN_25296 [Ceratobasidium sp. AG-Ba]